METEIRACEAALQELRIQYDQYFSGILRRPPLQEEERLRQTIVALRSRAARGAVKFRVEGLHQRFSSYQRMWARTVRSMEEGTFRRDVERARRRLGDAAGPQGPGSAGAEERGRRVGGSATGPGVDDAKLQRLYQAWMEARRRCNDTSRAPTYEQMAASIRKQVPKLMERHGERGIEFQVVIREGNAILRAVPKR